MDRTTRLFIARLLSRESDLNWIYVKNMADTSSHTSFHDGDLRHDPLILLW